ncbi:hypothetical protein Pla123a_48460 [Posidoniimonas polymericola]|uniref:Uncharacterized protein n=1 Tax=Posidoniimonas polymericola TaxID=2528002 RepID=A0A5C5XV62_9BACT|nr:hypothetical protein [Posidoniimonas polymericola]TWT65935.1 hypothetical protein Pla123a_48460 [Posidoniimonas polymericola]
MNIRLDTSVVAGALSPLVSSFDAAALQSLVAFRADDATQRRFDELAEKASDGTLSAAEQSAYHSMVGASTVVAVMQAEAEKLLSQSPPSRG